jgi:hypothetical protein
MRRRPSTRADSRRRRHLLYGSTGGTGLGVEPWSTGGCAATAVNRNGKEKEREEMGLRTSKSG